MEERDPLTLLRPQLEQPGVVDDEILASMDREVEAEIDAAVDSPKPGLWSRSTSSRASSTATPRHDRDQGFRADDIPRGDARRAA